MSTVYFESSAVLAWLFGESDAPKIESVLSKTDVVATSVLTLLEVERNLIRAEKMRKFSSADRQKIKGHLAKYAVQWTCMEITDAVQARVKESFPKEPIRSLDAIHLATMLEFVALFSDLTILSQDQRILANLESLGLTAVDL